MAKGMNVSLTEPLRDFVDSRTGDGGMYATPSEYIRDLIRRDMENQQIVAHVVAGLADVKGGQYTDKSILDIAEGR